MAVGFIISGGGASASNSKPNQVVHQQESKSVNPTGDLVNTARVEQKIVMAVKGLTMYLNADFNRDERVAIYPKQKRIYRPQFQVTDYGKATNGELRYKVIDINKNSQTFKKTGYITTSQKVVVNAYYSSIPKRHRIKIIAPKGINSYKRSSLHSKASHYRNGKTLSVSRVVKTKLTNVYQLKNGRYVSANKNLVCW